MLKLITSQPGLLFLLKKKKVSFNVFMESEFDFIIEFTVSAQVSHVVFTVGILLAISISIFAKKLIEFVCNFCLTFLPSKQLLSILNLNYVNDSYMSRGTSRDFYIGKHSQKHTHTNSVEKVHMVLCQVLRSEQYLYITT